uniref:Uncharacterized protein n=1 Tax=Anguilla anguilla TaxID=7936 RepID=A0A0E9XA34_ANGAN
MYKTLFQKTEQVTQQKKLAMYHSEVD